MVAFARLIGPLAVAGVAGLAARQRAAARKLTMSAANLASAKLLPLKGGAVSGAAVDGSALWKDDGALVFVVRRPG